MFEIEVLKKLRNDSIELNKHLNEINALLDTQNDNIDGMATITKRINKAFELYRTLVSQLDEQMKES